MKYAIPIAHMPIPIEPNKSHRLILIPGYSNLSIIIYKY